MPTKLLLDIPKFKGKVAEDPTNDVMSFHLWSSSNSIIVDSVCLCLFQRTLIGPTVKWHVDEPARTYSTFEGLTKTFLSLFQLSVGHDIGLELLTEIRQTTSTHIVDHIHGGDIAALCVKLM